MSTIYAITAKMQFHSQRELDNQQNRGAKILERLNANKKQNNSHTELLSGQQNKLSDELKEAVEYEGEHWFKTGVKEWVGLEKDSESLANKKAAITIEQKFDQREAKLLKAETGAVTSDLQSVIADSKANASELRKTRSKSEQIADGRRDGSSQESKTGFRGMKRMLRVQGDATNVQRESGQTALKQRDRSSEAQQAASLTMKDEDLKALVEKIDGEEWGRFFEKASVAINLFAPEYLSGLVANTNLDGIAESWGLEDAAEHTEASQQIGISSERGNETQQEAQDKLSENNEAELLNSSLTKSEQLI
jgi:hypothetical protein